MDRSCSIPWTGKRAVIWEIVMGKSTSAPPPPDYKGAAEAQAAAGRVNQYTPYGSMVYSQEAPAAQPPQPQPQPQPQPSGSPFSRGGLMAQPFGTGLSTGAGLFRNAQSPPASPNTSQWRSDITLSPVGQQLLEAGNQSALGLAELQGQAGQRVSQGLSQPFDYGSVGDVADASYAAQTSRLDPQWNERAEQNRTMLANQGLAPGGEAYDAAQRNFEQSRNDAYTQARLAAQNTMPQTYQLAQALRSQPLNELNALRTGSQVQNPTFTPIPQQQTTPGPNYLGAAQAGYGSQMDQYNAGVGQNNAMLGGLFSLGGAALGSPWG